MFIAIIFLSAILTFGPVATGDAELTKDVVVESVKASGPIGHERLND